jgi:hypothetical protein
VRTEKLLFDADTQFLAECRNVFGGLKGDVRTRLLAVLNNPCQQTWDDAHTIIMTGAKMTTLWQAVIAVAPTFPRSKGIDEPWPVVPDQFTLCRAIKQATRAVQAKAEPAWSGGGRHD